MFSDYHAADDKVNNMEINRLNSEHGLVGQLTFIQGKGEFPFISIQNKSASAIISLYAAQVLSFKRTSEPEDLLFLSRKAFYENGRAIRGGIPICWPWFGPNLSGIDLPDHGFVRNSVWTVVKTVAVSETETRIKLRFKYNPHRTDHWPQTFILELDIYVGESLTLHLSTHNTSRKTLYITQALHAYFYIGDIHKITILGLEKTDYLDKLDNGQQKHQSNTVTIPFEVDRIYKDVKSELTITDPVFNRTIVVTSNHHKTAIVWNPWRYVSAHIVDLEPEDYKRFVCLEAGNVATDILDIQPDNSVTLTVNYKILSQALSIKQSDEQAQCIIDRK